MLTVLEMNCAVVDKENYWMNHKVFEKDDPLQYTQSQNITMIIIVIALV